MLPLHDVDHDGPAREHEAPEGHVFDLAEILSARPDLEGEDFSTGEDAPTDPFPPDLFRLPVPNEVFKRDLSGAATRLLLVVMREAWGYDPDAGEWVASPRWIELSDLEDATRSELRMSRATLSRAARELEESRLLALQGGGDSRAPLELRCRVSVPDERFTWLPVELIEAHQFFSHSALLVLLHVYHATWGRTTSEVRGGDRTVLHRRWGRLTTDEIADRAGLCPATVRKVIHNLQEVGALQRGRPTRGTAWRYCPVPPDLDHPFFKNTRGDIHEENNKSQRPPTGEEQSSHQHQQAAAPHGEGVVEEADHFKAKGSGREPGGPVPPEGEVPEEFDDAEEGLYRLLTGSGFDLPHSWTVRIIRGRTEGVIRATLRSFQVQEERINDPGAWLRAALEESYHAPKTQIQHKPEHGGARRRRKPGEDHETEAVATALQGLAEGTPIPGPAADPGRPPERRPERDPDPITPDGESPAGDSLRPGGGGHSAPGVTYTRMCDLVEALGGPDVGTWNCKKRAGAPNLFTPSVELARWAWHRRHQGGERFQEAAAEVIELRKAVE